MSNGMQLSGLASGMDWQNVVDQLMELERFPIRKAQNEQAINNQRITELGILETKLNQLKFSQFIIRFQSLGCPLGLGL